MTNRSSFFLNPSRTVYSEYRENTDIAYSTKNLRGKTGRWRRTSLPLDAGRLASAPSSIGMVGTMVVPRVLDPYCNGTIVLRGRYKVAVPRYSGKSVLLLAVSHNESLITTRKLHSTSSIAC